jgi:FAD:protein FMN transferase
MVQARVRHVEHVMGTVVSFDAPAAVLPALRKAVRWLHWVDATFSTYRADSEVSRLGRGSVTLAECAPEVAEVLAAGAEVGTLSGGYFTLTPGGQLDPSGYVKGWAVERAAAMLAAAGSADHIVNGGGDLQCAGGRSPGEPWRVGVAHPLRPRSLALVVAGRDFAVATSATTERGAHIVDPHTGQPPSGLLSVTVAGPRLALADAYATAAFAMGNRARDWAESLDGYAAFGITEDGSGWQTPAFASYVAAA